MQRKAYVPGVAALLAVLLAGCTGGSGDDNGTTDPKPGESATTPTAAQPGKYRTLPEPCAAVSHGTLDSLLPGIKQVTDEEQRGRAYEGTATQTYDTDRKVGCRWKAESAAATDHLLVDFERVVSYDNAISDDDRATGIYLKRETAADLPEPVASSEPPESPESPDSSESPESSPEGSGSPSDDSGSGSGSGPSSGASDAESGDASGSATPSDGSAPSALQPRTLDDLGDEAFLDDALSSSRQRTVTVVFRTSNVVVTIQYDEQPATTTDVPSSKDMQDRARKLAGQLAETFND
ncbi:DUF3558 domain-containing protein [Streptomyces sp. IB201691-2A2]|uniref:DUF3558 domain-containing protein n=1 Tax=Streptomyces sp. IB201691-2A2 TaxID=2561920 RepID=UPI00117FDCD3|nr:DUF3558 domain-containing protein [Streptomyces sp. IB201691-2A2]TRO56877.1 DUF3558 domain-containing protein [Streptomyces sp. IB201691-2A2]